MSFKNTILISIKPFRFELNFFFMAIYFIHFTQTEHQLLVDINTYNNNNMMMYNYETIMFMNVRLGVIIGNFVFLDKK